MDLRKHIEATLLRPEKRWKEYEEFIEKSIEYKVFGVCIPPPRIKQAREMLKNKEIKPLVIREALSIS